MQVEACGECMQGSMMGSSSLDVILSNFVVPSIGKSYGALAGIGRRKSIKNDGHTDLPRGQLVYQNC